MPILVLGDNRFDYDINAWTNKDAMAIESATGSKWGEWLDSLSTTNVLSMTALVWMVRRKNGESELRFNDVEFSMLTIAVEPTEAEKARMEKEAEAEKNPTPAARPRAARSRSRTSGATASPS